MDMYRVIFANLECSAKVSGAEPALNRLEKIAQFRLLANELSKSKPSNKKTEKEKEQKEKKGKKAPKEQLPPTNRILYRYSVERVFVTGVSAELFGRCALQDSKDGDVIKMDINLKDDEFWPFVFSDQWSDYVGLRVHHGNLLNRLLVTLDRLAGSGDDGRLLGISVCHYDTDVDSTNLVSNPNESSTIPARMEFTFYGRKVASRVEEQAEQQSETRRRSSEKPTDELSSVTGVPQPVQDAPDVQNYIAPDVEGIQTKDLVDETHRESADMAPVPFDVGIPTKDLVHETHRKSAERAKVEPALFNVCSPPGNVFAGIQDHRESGLMNAPQETPSMTDSIQESMETSSMGSTTDGEDSPSGAPSQSSTTPTGSKERLKVGKKNARRGRKKKGKKRKKKKKKGDGSSTKVDKEEGFEEVCDYAAFHFDSKVKRTDEGDDKNKDEDATVGGGRKRGKSNAERGSVRKSTRISLAAEKRASARTSRIEVEGKGPMRKSTRISAAAEKRASARTSRVEVEDITRISQYEMFERTSKHARANFPSLSAYISQRGKARKRELCRKKVELRGAVLITNTCASAISSKPTAEETDEEEEEEEFDEREVEQRQTIEDSLQIISDDDPVKKDNMETEKGQRNSQKKQDESIKAKKKGQRNSQAKQEEKIETTEKGHRNSQAKQEEKIETTEKGQRNSQAKQNESLKPNEIGQRNSQAKQDDSLKPNEKGQRNSQAKQNESLKPNEIGQRNSQAKQDDSLKPNEKDQRNSQAKQKESLKTTDKHSLDSQNKQSDMDKENPVDNAKPRITKDAADRTSRQSDPKGVDEPTDSVILHARREARKKAKPIINEIHATSSASDKKRGKEKRKGSSVPTRVAIGQLGRSMTTWIINEPPKWKRTSLSQTETEPLQKSQCDVETTPWDFASATDFPIGSDNDGSSSNEDFTDGDKLDGSRTSANLVDTKRKESGKKSAEKLPRKSRPSSEYVRKSKAVLEQLQRRSTKNAELDEEAAKAEDAKKKKKLQQQQKWKKKNKVEKEEVPPIIQVEMVRRSQLNEWDVDEGFVRLLLEATDRFEVRKECISFVGDRMQTMQFVTFTRPTMNAYC